MSKYILLGDIQEVSRLCFVFSLKSMQQASLISYYILPLFFFNLITPGLSCSTWGL